MAERESILLPGPSDLPAAADRLGKLGFVPAMLVATDERTGPQGDLKLRWVFEPVAAADDRFVTLVVPVDPGQPEVPSLTPAMPAAN